MDTDRNLLFGVLALQLDLITLQQFGEACGAWAATQLDQDACPAECPALLAQSEKKSV
jgi:hypothetical protein